MSNVSTSAANKPYTYEELVKLRNDLQKIKNKQYAKEIKSIITFNNPELPITKNENGLYMCFQNLTQETYNALQAYVKKLKTNAIISETQDGLSSEHQPYSQNEYPFEGNSKLRYSNKEKNLIKRKLYDKELKNQNSVIGEEPSEQQSDVVSDKQSKPIQPIQPMQSNQQQTEVTPSVFIKNKK
jgi:hypothetical protein